MQRIEPVRPELPLYEEYCFEIKDIFTSGILTNNGPKLQKFQNLLRDRMKVNNLELFVNGHLALTLGIKAMKLPKGGEVLTSPFTFVSTTNAIIQNGLEPVFCDIDDTYNISIDSIKNNITDKTCAIITPHIFGIPCHVFEIEEIACKYALKVIYDAAQAFGTKVNGNDIATYGDGTMFSLHAIKVFNSIEGGIFCFKEKAIKNALQEERNFGICPEDKMNANLIGTNAKMDEFRAAMGIVNLKKVDDSIKKRKKLAKRYIDGLSGIEGITTYAYGDNIDYNYAYFPINVDEAITGFSRDQLFDELRANDIGSRKLYSRLTCDYNSIVKKGYRCDTNYARKMTTRCLDLPLYSTLDYETIDRVIEVIRKTTKKY